MRDDYVDEDRRGERGRGRKKNKKKHRKKHRKKTVFSSMVQI